MKTIYEKIVKVLKKYIVMDEKYYPIVSLWVIGTYYHKSFRTYPYLYFNAMKGSGKTRTLGLLAHLSYKGKVIVDLTEAVLFRTAAHTSFFIDEIERINRRERGNLRLLLNSAYKQGIVVRRMRKEKEDHVVDEFNVFTPIAMANISGMDNVLQDRCITIILEKSFNPYVTRMIEDWDADPDIKELHVSLKDMVAFPDKAPSLVSFSAVSLHAGNIYSTLWNELLSLIRTTLNDTSIHRRLNDTIHTPHITTLNNTTINNDKIVGYLSQIDYKRLGIEPSTEVLEFIKFLWPSGLDGRNLELFLPIIMIAYEIDQEMAPEIVKTAEYISAERKAEDIAENRDMSFVGFLGVYVGDLEEGEYVKVSELAKAFKTDEEEQWINSRWVGRSLKRLGLVFKKRRLARGREVILNSKKILYTAKRFGINIEETKAERSKEDQQRIDDVVEEVAEEIGVPEKLKKRR